MTPDIKVGDLVETCSLMPGVVMKRDDDHIKVRMLDIDDYSSDHYAGCSITHCGVIKITAKQALNRLILGKEVVSQLYFAGTASDSETFNREYETRLEESVRKKLNG